MALAVGTGGVLRTGYQVVARLGRWSVDGRDESLGGPAWTIRAAAEDVDPHWLAHAEGVFALELAFGTRRWRWPAIEATVQGPHVVARSDQRPEER